PRQQAGRERAPRSAALARGEPRRVAGRVERHQRRARRLVRSQVQGSGSALLRAYAPDTPEARAAVRHEVIEGSPVEVDALLESYVRPEVTKPAPKIEAPWRSTKQAIAAVRQARESTRSETLNRATFFCARRGQDLREELAEAARDVGLDETEIERTIESAW